MRQSKLSITHNEITSEILTKIISGKTPARIGFRIAIIQAIMDGVPIKDLSNRHHISRYGIYKLVNRINEHGIKGLYEGEHTGRKSRLTNDLRNKIMNWLKKPPFEYGYNQSRWDGALLRKYLQEKEGVIIGHSQINVWLHKLNFTLQRGRQKLIQADDKEQKQFIKKLKKN